MNTTNLRDIISAGQEYHARQIELDELQQKYIDLCESIFEIGQEVNFECIGYYTGKIMDFYKPGVGSSNCFCSVLIGTDDQDVDDMDEFILSPSNLTQVMRKNKSIFL